MKDLIFATNNAHKLEEITSITKAHFRILTLNDIGFSGEIPETSLSIEGNALQKAEFIYKRFSTNCFADDTGLEVDALDGAPGVYSARYAGENASYTDNVVKLLEALKGIENRNARFKTVIALIIDGQPYFFEGIISGKISDSPKGTSGFGYDPIFIPEGYQESFAEMPSELKNIISHRGLATKKLTDFLLNKVKEHSL
ncbi:MAG: dITP/XTP pyrophosphatase [Bacteroidetes bacterium]|nr:MAG: dITP/XTP pyrophosphatase [Bacteroidota bacterium]